MSGGEIVIQLGQKDDDKLNFSFPAIDLDSLDLANANVLSRTNAHDSIDKLTQAISKVTDGLV